MAQKFVQRVMTTAAALTTLVYVVGAGHKF
jgi:hypothetical protein